MVEIRNEKNLSTYERAHVASKLLALNIRPNNGDFSLKHYLGIHKYLFEEVYPFAGEIRNVDITKGGTYFARFQYIEPELDKILNSMKSELPKVSSMDEYAEKLAGYYLDINIAHPFREGNGRCEREFFREYVLHLNKVLKNFGTTDQVMEIVSVIANRTLNTKVKGIKILKNYNRQKTCKPFGDVVLEAFPDTTDVIGKNALNTFLKKLNVTLEEYLYNDGIYLILTDKNKVKNTNQKFNNKAKQRYNSCDLEVL